ncbi:uncharacterized protein [Euwallacea similis]|uniref:uncharacterized protein isoform X2 n=1 Tax=Euwallacea similis TaxID=1736056 RepID=UPI00344DA37F
MGKGKIDMCVEDWIHFQHHRVCKMSKVRVEIEDNQFYGRLKIYKDHVVIFPYDEEIRLLCFQPRELHGLIEVGNRGIQINQRFQRPPIILYLKTPAKRDVLMERFKSFISDESTSESAPSSANSDSS